MKYFISLLFVLLIQGCVSIPDSEQQLFRNMLDAQRTYYDEQKLLEWQIKVNTLENGSIQRNELVDKCITIFNYDWVKPKYRDSTRNAFGTEVHGWEVYTNVNYFTGNDHKYAKILCDFDNIGNDDYIAIREYKLNYSYKSNYLTSRRHRISRDIPGIRIGEKL